MVDASEDDARLWALSLWLRWLVGRLEPRLVARLGGVGVRVTAWPSVRRWSLVFERFTAACCCIAAAARKRAASWERREERRWRQGSQEWVGFTAIVATMYRRTHTSYIYKTAHLLGVLV